MIFNRHPPPFAQPLLALLLLALLAPAARAELSVVINKGNDQATHIAIIPFSLRTSFAAKELQEVDDIIVENLAKSGQFKLLDVENMLSFPTDLDEVYYRDWRLLGVRYLAFGQITKASEGVFMINFYLLDVLQEKLLLQDSTSGFLTDVRSVAHYISDLIYEQVNGIPGVFATQILYVSVNRGRGNKPTIYQLMIADSDGRNSRALYKSEHPLLSPDWSPNGREIAYVSFEVGWRVVVRHDLITDSRSYAVDPDDQSSAPSFSPDGSKLAMAIVRAENTDIYIYDIPTAKLERITTHYRDDTEPSWMPDGKSIVFTSNRSGGPQIYRKYLASGEITRLSFDGRYNADAKSLPDGRRLALLHRSERNQYRVALLDIASNKLSLLAATEYKDSPGVSPNGVMLIYSTKISGRGVLAVTSLDGITRYHLPDRFGNEVRHPVWAPFFSIDAAAAATPDEDSGG